VRGRRLTAPAGAASRRLLADVAGLVSVSAFYVVVSVVLAGLWRAATAHGPVAGYTGRELTWYIVTAEAATCAINPRLIEEIGDDVVSGAVTVEMLRPAAVGGVRLAVETGRALTRLAVLLPVGAVIGWTAVGPPPDATGALLAVPALALAVAVNVAMQHAVAGISFWLRDTRAAWFLYQKLVFILGGMLLPLEVLPDVLRHVASALPFAAMAYVPARTAAGHVAPGLLLVQAGWLVVFVVAALAVFGAGERRLQEVGT